MDWLGKIKEWIKKESRPRRLWGQVKSFAIRRAQSKQFWKWLTIGAVTGAGVVLLSIAVFGVADWSLTDLEHTPKEKQAEVRSVIVRNIGLAIAAGIGLGVGFWRAYTAHQQTKPLKLQAQTAARGHFAERFAAAAEHLGHDSLAVRLGGLYALAALGRGAEDSDVVSIVDVICSFVRTGPPKKDQKQGGAEGTQPPERSDKDTGGKKITEDIQVALDILTDSETGLRKRLPEGHHLNLQGTDLCLANLDGADLVGANLTGADLTKARLFDADLREADLRKANLSGARLSKANLSGTDLRKANLCLANLTKARLFDADLCGANLTKARLFDADLSEADLRKANLSGARLSKANLDGADLVGANLTGADLTYANLVHAKLYAANLRGANLSEAKLSGANLYEADLNRADLYLAELDGATLDGANLTGADLSIANLTGANLLRVDLSGADLREAQNLSQEQLNSAALSDFDKPPLLPAGLKPPTDEYEPPLWMRDRLT